jgi:hypothetical protein
MTYAKAERKNLHCDQVVTSDKRKGPLSPLFVIATTSWFHPDAQPNLLEPVIVSSSPPELFFPKQRLRQAFRAYERR